MIPLNTPATEEALLVPYPATLDVPHELVEHVAWLLYEHRRARNTRWRKLGCFKQASMKHRRHGMSVQVIARPDGTPL